MIDDKRHFTKEDRHMKNKHNEKNISSLQEMQIKTTINYYYTSIIKWKKNTKQPLQYNTCVSNVPE